MGSFVTAALFIVIGLTVGAVGLYQHGRQKPTPAWEVSGVEVVTYYRMKSPDMKGYRISHSTERLGKRFRAYRWQNGDYVLNEHADSFVEAERIVFEHAGKARARND